MRRLLALLCVASLALQAQAQSSKTSLHNTKLGRLTVEVTVTSNGDGKGQSAKMLISPSHRRRHLQEIDLGDVDRAELEIGDYNFDGNQDIRVRGTNVGIRNESSTFFVFSAAHNRFVKDRVLSRLSNVTFNPKLKQVTSVNLGGGTSEYREVFKPQGHKWVRVAVSSRE